MTSLASYDKPGSLFWILVVAFRIGVRSPRNQTVSDGPQRPRFRKVPQLAFLQSRLCQTCCRPCHLDLPSNYGCAIPSGRETPRQNRWRHSTPSTKPHESPEFRPRLLRVVRTRALWIIRAGASFGPPADTDIREIENI